jgi:hypothetical protein
MPTIPIRREAGYRTDSIGWHAGGQFLRRRTQPAQQSARRRPTRRHRPPLLGLPAPVRRRRPPHNSRIQLIGYGRGIPSTISDLLATLHGVEFDDIAIQLFRLDYDGYTFGLIDESDSERGPWFELYPDQLGFHPPFNGDYDT